MRSNSLNSRFTSVVFSAVTHESTASDIKSADASEGLHVATLEPEYAVAKDAIITKIRESGQLPPKMIAFMDHFVTEYGIALQQSNNEKATPQGFLANMGSAIHFGMKYGMPNSPYLYQFGVTHDAIRGNPEAVDRDDQIDFYAWGCDFFRPCMDLDNSVVMGEDNLKEAFEYISKGENVVFLANHQSEADPQVFSCMLEKVGLGKQGEQIYYVAGHKVTTDVLAIPFSMGRNLLCIHSKKHIDSDPEAKPMKMKQNLATMSAMQNKMKTGGHAFWVAPSGGRDRRDISTGKVPAAPFDQKTIDMFRLMSNKAKTPTHFYSLAMVSYDLCPPPDTIEAGTGEMRNIRFSPVGIACSKELENKGGVESRHLFTEHAQEEVEHNYDALLTALNKY